MASICECGKPKSKNGKRCRDCGYARRSAQRDTAPYENREWLRHRYEDLGMTLEDIAREIGAKKITISRWRVRHEIPVRWDRRHPAPPPGRRADVIARETCPDCGGRKAGRNALRCMPCKNKHALEQSIADVMSIVRTWSANNWRPAIFERDGSCQRCGGSEKLHAHHIVHLSTIIKELTQELQPELNRPEKRVAFARKLSAHPRVQDLGNGVLLCDECHRGVHAEEGYGARSRKARGLS